MTDERSPNDYAALLQQALDALDQMEARAQAEERRRHEPIAVVGMGMRFPGPANDPEQFWDLLMSGRDAVTEVPDGRWDLDDIFDPSPGAPGKSYTRWGAFVEDIDRFDATFFGITPREAASMDPQQRVLLEVAWETFENAGIAPSALAGTQTGVFVGMSGREYGDLALEGGVMSHVDAYFPSGVALSIAAGRIAYTFDLRGPALSLDTACSSSLLTVHLAARALRAGECDAALAGGVNLLLSPDGHILTSQARMMSFEGRCKTFDAAADGYVRGEGCGLVLLKRLSDAQADGDRILAVIRGTAANQDGRSNGLTAPNGAAQESVIRAALADGGVAPHEVDFVECHGTGTTLGDPIEVRALEAVFGPGRTRPLAVQSVKSNIGHLEAAAGIAGLCKLILAVRNGSLPAHLHLTLPNPRIPWSEISVVPESGPAAWPERDGGPRTGSMSAFGFSGTNVHVVVEQAPPETESTPKTAVPPRQHRVYPVSARTDAALADLARRHADVLGGFGEPSIAVAAAAAATSRAHLDARLAVVSDERAATEQLLRRAADGETGPDIARARAGDVEGGVTMLFTGQGSQSPGMGRGLYAAEPAFAASLDQSAAIVRDICGLDLLGLMFADDRDADGRTIHDTAFAQLGLFAYELAMADLWASWGVVPAAVLGHSIGEIVAAHVAGVMTRVDALRIVEARGRLMQALPRDGGMVSLMTDATSAAELIAPWTADLAIAAVNGPRSVVVSGRRPALDELVAVATEAGIRVVRLEVSHAFHSPSMDPMLDEFESVVAGVELREPVLELFSNRTGGSAAPGLLTSARYWRDHVRGGVRFAESVDAALASGSRVFLEVGPAATLTAMARGVGAPADATFVASARAGGDESRDVQRALAALYCRGIAIDWGAYAGGGVRRPDGLPRYPFERQRHWLPEVDPRRPRHAAYTGGAIAAGVGLGAGDALFGAELSSARLRDHVYARELTAGSPPWMADHVVYDGATVPATAYLEMMRRAAEHTVGPVDLTDVRIDEALVVGDQRVSVQTIVTEDGTTVEVHSSVGDGWRRHASAVLSDVTDSPVAGDGGDVAGARQRCEQVIESDVLYDAFARVGVRYGPSFRCIDSLQRRDFEVVATLHVPEGPDPSAGLLHPGLADACLQVLGLGMPGAGDLAAAEHAYLPVGVGRYHVANAPRGPLTAHATVDESSAAGGQFLIGEVRLFDVEGRLVLAALGVRFMRVARSALAAAAAPADEWAYVQHWEPVAARSAGGEDGAQSVIGGRWLLVDGSTVGANAHADGLAEALTAIGAHVERIATVDAHERIDANTTGVLFMPHPALRAPEAAAATAHLATTVATSNPNAVLVVVTVGAAAVTPGDRVDGYGHAALWGVARVAQAELRRPLRIIDVPDLHAPTVAALVSELFVDPAEAVSQLALRGGIRYVPRLVRPADLDALAAPAGPYELQIDERGRLDALRLAPQDELQPGPGEVLIDVAATGLNFRDVLNAMGTYAGVATSLGNECAGTVVAVGPGVTRAEVGDRVMAVVTASFASRCLAPELMVTRQPESWSDAESATVPIAFLTADWALDHLGHMRAGERVLIHAAAGGVGLAAVMLAQRAGVEIYATAGSDRKRDALRALGVRHIYDSRSAAFGEEVLRDTGGEGVHLVLNSLSGETIPASIAAMAHGGRFLEIGLAGIWDHERFRAARPDAEYHVIFLGEACLDEPDVVAARFDALADAFDAGELRPLPLIAFDARHSPAAFRYMAQARQIGKVVITADHGWRLGTEGGTWIISGGLGGLGLATAAELAEAGAARIVLFGRTAPDPAADDAIEALRGRCPDVRFAAVDITDAAAVAAMVEDATADGTPLSGIVHAAGVLDDALLRDLDVDRFDAVWGPKVIGLQNLMVAADRHRPRHVVVYSSAANLFGSPGQGNYAAANAALDALTHARRSDGLPAQTINWGPWTTVGMAARLGDQTLRRWEAQGIVGLEPDEGRRALRNTIRTGAAQVAIVKLRWGPLLHHFSKHPVPEVLESLVRSERRRSLADGGGRSASGTHSDFFTEIEAVDVDQRVAWLADRIRVQVLKVLGLDEGYPLDPAQGLTDVGMDSLMAVELANRLSVLVDRSLPSTLAFEQPTIELLTAHLRELLAGRVVFATEAAGSGRADAEQAQIDELAAMSEDEAAERLLRELEESGY